MAPTDPFIVWPAPGFPALLDPGDGEFRAIAATASGAGEVRAWWREPALVGLDGARTSLRLVDATPLRDGERPAEIAGFAQLPEASRLTFVSCRLRPEERLRPHEESESRLFHLAGAGRLLKTRCAAMINPGRRELRIAFASDIHYSSRWEQLLDAVRKHLPAGSGSAVDPQQNWRRFVADANFRWRQGELDLVVLGGDLVDHVRRAEDPFGAETNVSRFRDALDELHLPTFVIPGNHDYRLNPWRPRAYGLDAIGLERQASRRVLASAGLWRGGPPGLRDLRSLYTRDEQGTTALAEHLRLLAPATEFHVDVAGTRLIFASSGADALARWRTAGIARLPALVRSLPHSWVHPDSEGLYDEQIETIVAGLQGTRGAALFLHSPLLHSSGSDPVSERIDWNALRTTAEVARLERRWQTSGLRTGVCWHNAVRLLDRLFKASCPAAVFSGHVHRATRLDIERGTGQMRSADPSMPLDADQTIALLTAPPIGQADHSGGAQGYLEIHFDQGRLRSVEVRALRSCSFL